MIQGKNFNLIGLGLTSTHYRVIKTTIDNSVAKNFIYPSLYPFLLGGSPIDEFYLSNTIIQNSYMVIRFIRLSYFGVVRLDNVTFENSVASTDAVIYLFEVGSFEVNGITFTNYT
jgi:hypothetical protein